MNVNPAVILRETAARPPGKPALHPGGALTYGELDAASDQLAAGPAAAGAAC